MKLFESIIKETATEAQAIILLLVVIAMGVVFSVIYCLIKHLCYLKFL